MFCLSREFSNKDTRTCDLSDGFRNYDFVHTTRLLPYFTDMSINVYGLSQDYPYNDLGMALRVKLKD